MTNDADKLATGDAEVDLVEHRLGGAGVRLGQALDLQGVDLRAFIQDVSRATGSTFILDPRVQGTVTITSQSRMQAPELLGVLLATLRANGLADRSIAMAVMTGALEAYPGAIGVSTGWASPASKSGDCRWRKAFSTAS